MKRSIKLRFTAVFVCLMAMVLITTWCVNNWYLESFYTLQKIHTLEKAYELLDTVARQESENGDNIIDEYQRSYNQDNEVEGSIQQILRVLSEQSNSTLVLVDSFTDRVLIPSTRDGAYLVERAQKYIFGKDMPQAQVLRSYSNYTVQKTYDTKSRSYYLESWGYFSDNRTYFLISTPLASIRESVDLANRFLGYVGIVSLFVGSIFIYFTTKKITSPILELAGLSEKMSDLNFEIKYTGDAQDEIGVLGGSMNKLSDKLEETIKELKEANLELKRDIEEKIKIDEMRKDFIANVSHELKTPIALIQGYAEGLAEGMAQEKESRDYYCEVIADEAGKMNKMVRQLLTLSALEAGGHTLSVERFDLTELIQGVISSVNIIAEQKNAEISFDAAQSIYVWADEFKIEEVITNYLNNALNHLDERKKIIIKLEKKEEEVMVTVFNSGTPIPQNDIPNLWTKFYKVDKARTRAYGGSGIGLSIVKAIMDSHQKECGVYNTDEGVIFWFTLDCRDGG